MRTFLLITCKTAFSIVMFHASLLGQTSINMSTVPLVSITPLDYSGLVLEGASWPLFQSEVDGLLTTEGLQAIHPLISASVLLVNNTGMAIIGYSICWTGTDSSNEIQRSFQVVLGTNQLKGIVDTGSKEFISLAGSQAQMASLGSPGLATRIAQQAAWINKQRTVSISIDAVVFKDGSVVGVDDAHIFLRLKASLKSENDLFRLIADQTNKQQVVDLLSELVRQNKEDGGAKPVASRVSESQAKVVFFKMNYNRERATAATDLLRMISDRGFDATMRHVAEVLKTKSYPLGLLLD